MLNKLAMAGIKNRFRDYAVLFSGLIIGSAIFYMFMTMATNRDFQNANSTVSMTPIIFMFGAILLTIITFVYIIYANSFLLSMRKHDYATFMMLGAKSGKISQLIFTETMVIGLGVTVVGIVLGIGATQVVGKLLMQALDAPARHFAPFYLPAVIVTAVFFVVLFFLAAIVNASKMAQTPILELLRSDVTPSRVQHKPVMLTLSAILGVVSLAIGYWAMASLKVLNIMAIPVALVTIVLGSFLLFNAVVVAVIQLLKKNQRFASKGLRNFTLSQISFRVRSYTAILSVVSILFALALGAITVGLGFYHSVPEMAQSFNAYSVVTRDATPSEQALADKLTDKTASHFTVKYTDKGVAFRASDLKRNPIMNAVTDVQGTKMTHSREALTVKDITTETGRYAQSIDAVLDAHYAGKGKTVTVLDDAAFTALNGRKQQITAYHVANLRANIKTIGKIQEHENKRFPKMMVPGYINTTYEAYQAYNAMSSGFAFMGFFLGIAFLAMLASTLMFKILSSADYDRSRYHMLDKMGVRRGMLKKSIRTELFVLFALPGALGVVHVLFGLKLFYALLLNPYDGILLPFGIFIVLYLIYYALTVWLYEGIVLRDSQA